MTDLSRICAFLSAAFLLMIAFSPPTQAQVPQKVITTNADNPRSVYAADLNGDGQTDVLSASQGDNKIAWHENNGDGTFSDQKVITTDANAAESVYAADLNGDGKKDVLSASDDDDKIAWYENNGNGTFSDQKVITTDADGAQSVYAADLTDDGDKDVLSASRLDEKIAWYENNGNGAFSDQKVITTNVNGTRDVHAADLAGSSDPDVLSFSPYASKLTWYENNGDGSFSNQKVITTDVDGAQSVYAADLTDDGNKDVLSASGDDSGKIAWYKNNGDGSFSNQKVITTDVAEPEGLHAADLNGDGKKDVLSASDDDDKIAWYENNGDGAFSDQKVIDTADGAQSVFAANLNGDNQTDVLSASDASQGDDKIAWYENADDVLPVELTGFSAQAFGTGARLAWQTASETNNAGFEVQRQKEKGWTQVGFVDSKAAGGTTTEAKSYSYTADDLPVGTHQFRLKQVDLDGSSTLTDPVSVDIQMQEAVKLTAPAPNPASSNATLSFAVKEQSETTITLYNTLGQQVATVYEGTPQAGEEQRTRVDVSRLSSGTYFLRLNANGQTRTRRLTVVR